MKIRQYTMERLTPRTCEVNEAVYGVACNKTVFLLQEYMQLKGEKLETWTILHYENDRFGLINGLIYLVRTREAEHFEMYFAGNKMHESCFFRFDKEMSYVEISRIVDILYMNTVEYR